MVTSLDLLAFLDSLGTSYPGGIPRVARTESVPSGEGGSDRVRCRGPLTAPLVFVGFSQTQSLLDGPSGALLEAAVAKGLKLDPAAIAFVSVGEGARGAEVSAALKNLAAPIGVALGGAAGDLLGLSASSGEWSDSGGRAWRVTVDLDAVLADPALKRPFWSDLQAVGQRLAETTGGRS